MNQWRHPVFRSVLVVLAVLSVVSVSAAHAQSGRLRGRVTDQWENGIAGVVITTELVAGGAGRETTTDEDGDFVISGVPPGDWLLEFRADGYQGVRAPTRVQALNTNRPLRIELEALPPGGRLNGDPEFEAEGGTPNIKFTEDGRFEFVDAEGEGQGTYGIVELTAVMVVRDYDGPDDKYSIAEPVVVTFPTDQHLSLTWGDATLPKK